MKSFKFACITLITVIVLVSINTVILKNTVDSLITEVSKIEPDDIESIKKAHSHFKKSEGYLSLTVTHDDLTNTEEIFAELIGYASISDENGVLIAKSRLSDALLHLKRLVGFNFDTVL